MFKMLFSRPLVLLAVLALLVASAFAVAATDMHDQQPELFATGPATDWLIKQQVDDGGFSAFGGESDPGSTADVVYALVSAGIDPASVTSSNGTTPLIYLSNPGDTVAGDPGLAGKTILALIASGHDIPAELITTIKQGQHPETAIWGQSLTSHAYAMLGLSAAGEPLEPGMTDALLDRQIEDGSWGFTGSTDPGTGDSNSTALAIQALVAAGAGNDAVARGVEYILSLRDASGAIAYDASEAPNLMGDANSTALAIQALIAAGEDAGEQLAALEQFQAESGAFFWRSDWADDSLLATAQAVPALHRQPLPLPEGND